MIVRSAVLEGTIEGADRERFAHHMRQVVLPAIAQYPRIRDVRLRGTLGESMSLLKGRVYHVVSTETGQRSP